MTATTDQTLPKKDHFVITITIVGAIFLAAVVCSVWLSFERASDADKQATAVMRLYSGLVDLRMPDVRPINSEAVRINLIERRLINVGPDRAIAGVRFTVDRVGLGATAYLLSGEGCGLSVHALINFGLDASVVTVNDVSLPNRPENEEFLRGQCSSSKNTVGFMVSYLPIPGRAGAAADFDVRRN